MSFDPSNNKIEETLFFPSLENEQKLAQQLSETQKELQIAIFTFTNKLLANTILQLVKDRNINVRIISDDAQSAQDYSLVGVLREANSGNIQVRIDNNKNALMHNKYVIIDQKKVITGSFNWTQQAVRQNNENVVILQGRDIAKSYYNNFEELWTKFEDNIYNVNSQIKQKGKDMYKNTDPELLKKLQKKVIKKATYSKLKEKILRESQIKDSKVTKKIQKNKKIQNGQKLPNNSQKEYSKQNGNQKNNSIVIQDDSDSDYIPEENPKRNLNKYRQKKRMDQNAKNCKQGMKETLLQIFKKASVVGGFVGAAYMHYNLMQDIE